MVSDALMAGFSAAYIYVFDAKRSMKTKRIKDTIKYFFDVVLSINPPEYVNAASKWQSVFPKRKMMLRISYAIYCYYIECISGIQLKKGKMT